MDGSCLQESVCRKKPDLWVTVGYMKLCVDRHIYSG
jgi:hypothetical protein